MIERLWAGWRSSYLEGLGDNAAPGAPSGGSLFEDLLSCGLPDSQTYIVWRGTHCFALLNLFPYTSGHLLVLPKRAIADLEALDADTAAELWQAVGKAVVAVKSTYRPDGVNVGANLGAAAGAGVPGHLHVHVLPRWFGDTNFTTAIAETRVMAEPLDVSWKKLTGAWPR